MRLSGPRIIRCLRATIAKHGRENLPTVLGIPNNELNIFFVGHHQSRLTRTEFNDLADKIETALVLKGVVVK
jgi:hypothetical protein